MGVDTYGQKRPVCTYFARGNCRYGDNCRFDHPFRGPTAAATAPGSVFGGQPRPAAAPATPSTFQELLNGIATEMKSWENSKQWPFSCFSPLKGQPCIPGLSDLSPEEVRAEAYRCQVANTPDAYLQFFNTQVAEYRQKRASLHNASPEMRAYMQQMFTASLSGASAGGAAGAAGAGGAAGGGTSVFGATTQSSKSLFGGGSAATQPAAGLFGKPAVQPVFGGQQTGGSSVFGSQQTSGSSVFGGGQTGGSSVFGGQQTGGSSVFGGQPQAAGSVFGGGQPTAGGSVFGGQTQSTGSVFGGQAQSTGSVFGGQTQPTGSVFGGQSQPSSSVFGGQTAPPQGPTGSVFGGGQSQPAGSVFGGPSQPPAGAQSSAPAAPAGSVFNPQVPPPTSSVFGSQASGPTGQPAPPAAGGGLFGKGGPVASTGASQPAGAADAYSEPAELSERDRAQFAAAEFTLGMVPLLPPTREMCAR